MQTYAKLPGHAVIPRPGRGSAAWSVSVHLDGTVLLDFTCRWKQRVPNRTATCGTQFDTRHPARAHLFFWFPTWSSSASPRTIRGSEPPLSPSPRLASSVAGCTPRFFAIDYPRFLPRTFQGLRCAALLNGSTFLPTIRATRRMWGCLAGDDA